ncbi:MAG: hypothetical protein PHV37_01795 [Candidatus Gastranaerophilales bacterium]|nr:hypothetical protein [Candidatus Gastranaerophilales bacterium]
MEHALEINPQLTAISLAYTNQGLIADKVLKRVPVKTESFKYNFYPKAQMFTVPDTTIGRKGQANEVELKSEIKDASVEDHGLKDCVPAADVEAAQKANAADPIAKNTIFTTDLVALAREKRVASVIQNPDNYGHKETLSSSDKISNNLSSPISMFEEASNACFMKPTHAVMNRKVLSVLRQHPEIVQAYNKNSGDKGKVPLAFLIEFLELEDILVGQSVVNTAKKGQTPVYNGVWGNHISLYYQNPIADVDYGLTFGVTAEYETRRVLTYFDNDRGIKGSHIIKVVEQNKDLILAPDCGAIMMDVI